MNSNGTLFGVGKNVTGVSHPYSGVYCIGLASGISPSYAVVSLTDDSLSGAEVYTVRNNPACSGGLEVDTLVSVLPSSTTPGHHLDSIYGDSGFTVLVP